MDLLGAREVAKDWLSNLYSPCPTLTHPRLRGGSER